MKVKLQKCSIVSYALKRMKISFQMRNKMDYLL